ncbi:histidine phosphatase family protein [Hydrogenophaga soli]
MNTLTFIRHGQASFGANDYDQLSPLGEQQSEQLGRYLRQRAEWQGRGWDAVITGNLKRHRQTWEALARGAGWDHTPTVLPGLDEYDSDALIRALPISQPMEKPTTPEGYKQHFRALRDALRQWMDGTISPQGMPTYNDFVAGVTGVLAHVRQHHMDTPGGRVLVVSSGGPISTLVGHLLSTPAETTIEINMQIRNTALTEVMLTPRTARLVSFNALPHLDGPAFADWVTHA